MSKYDRLPAEVQQAIQNYGHSHKLDQFLQDWRRDIESRNWLNNWSLSSQDQLFVDFHNEYLSTRNIK